MRNMKHLTHLRGLFAVLWGRYPKLRSHRGLYHQADCGFLGGGDPVCCHFEAGPRVDSTLVENKLFCYHEQWVTITDWLQRARSVRTDSLGLSLWK
jgi:hypothetical protein